MRERGFHSWSVCLSGLNLLLQGSSLRATSYYACMCLATEHLQHRALAMCMLAMARAIDKNISLLKELLKSWATLKAYLG